jgi:hypothetical protein
MRIAMNNTNQNYEERRRGASLSLALALSLCLSASLASASPFDDAFDSFDDPPQGESTVERDQRDDRAHISKDKHRRAPRCLTPLDQTALDHNRARLRRKSDDLYGELNKQITLYFLDAESGEGVRGAQVTLGGVRGRTDRAGRVCFEYPKGDLMDTQLDADFARRGYTPMRAELRFMAGALFFNRFTVTQLLPPGRLRVVLDWDARPTDLDAHLVREGTYHISYRKMASYLDRAKLDRDDRDGYGPETITINRLDSQAAYRFFVHDYTRSGRLAKSKAHVRVYTERGLLKTFTVSPQQRGDHWEVFRIERGQLR